MQQHFHNKKKHEIKFFQSFSEQEEYKLKQLAELTGEEILRQMRQLINLAYGMYGFNSK